jgi:MFS family permease
VTTYREIFALREFRTLFLGNALTVAGRTIQMLALSSLVYAATDAPLLAALALFGGLLPQAVGALTLLSFADRVRPRTFLALWSAAGVAEALLLASGVLPIVGMLLLIMAFGVVDSVTSAVRGALLADVLPGGFVLGRSILNVSVGGTQIVGFAVGGVLITTVSPRGALLISAGLACWAALNSALGLRNHPPRAAGRGGFTMTFRLNRALWTTPSIRPILLAASLPNGLIVGAEAMYVPYAVESAGVLFVAGAAGMLLGDVVVGRWMPAPVRERWSSPLRALLAIPYLLFVFHPAMPVAAAAVFVASVGYAATLGLQQRLVDRVPASLTGQAIGLEGSGRMTFQAIGASVIGSVAEFTGPATAMTVAGVASLLVTLSLWIPLRVPWSSPLSESPVMPASPAA